MAGRGKMNLKLKLKLKRDRGSIHDSRFAIHTVGELSC